LLELLSTSASAESFNSTISTVEIVSSFNSKREASARLISFGSRVPSLRGFFESTGEATIVVVFGSIT
jgi:hypothetical protein